MNSVNLSQQLHYRIIVECNNNNLPITLAGFDAEEQTESLLCRHLSNLCMQSDGSFCGTQQLVVKLMKQWQQSFRIPAMQILQTMGGQECESVVSVCLYKQTNSSSERLVNKINF